MATNSKLAKVCGQSLMLGLTVLLLTSVALAVVVLADLIARVL